MRTLIGHSAIRGKSGRCADEFGHHDRVPNDYAMWLEQVAPQDQSDPGVRPDGADRFLQEIFAHLGPISVGELKVEADRVAERLARTAVDLVLHDLHATTDARPLVEIRLDDEYGLIISYNGGYTTPAFSSMQNPEATVEIAAHLQGEIAEDVSTVWPVCPSHRCGLDAKASDGEAVWSCRADGHQVATIGELAP
jgi:hypothetical protein